MNTPVCTEHQWVVEDGHFQNQVPRLAVVIERCSQCQARQERTLDEREFQDLPQWREVAARLGAPRRVTMIRHSEETV